MSTEYSEACCFNEPRSCCQGDGCPCACHEVQVTIHGKYSNGIMPAEFRDALVRLTQLVVEAVDRHDDCIGSHRLPGTFGGTVQQVCACLCHRDGIYRVTFSEDEILDGTRGQGAMSGEE